MEGEFYRSELRKRRWPGLKPPNNENCEFNRRWDGIDADFTGENKTQKLTDGRIPYRRSRRVTSE